VTLNIQILLTGSELVNGDIIDSNSALISQQLQEAGYLTQRRVTVGDQLDLLITEIQEICAQADILIINGGLGPTQDDLTSEAIATAAQVTLKEHPGAIHHLENWCLKRGFKLNKPNRKQALLPKGAEILPNPAGSAVGFHLRIKRCYVLCTPGVPHELEKMLIASVIPKIQKDYPLQNRIHTSHLPVFGLGESYLQKMINDHFPDFPKTIEIGFRAAMPIVDVKLTTSDESSFQLKQEWETRLRNLLGSHIIGIYPTSLPREVVQVLTQKNQRVTTAESCTGGKIASLITTTPGSSHIFEAGFVTYSNKIKTRILGVPFALLEKFGAVSQQVVEQMLIGALKQSDADLGVAVSGIAGPDGGSEDKPVGTVWIAWGSESIFQSICLYLPGSRHYFQEFVAAAALDLIRRIALDISEPPLWIQIRQSPK